MPVVLPLHPRSRARSDRVGLGSLLDAMHTVEPLDYPEFLALLAESSFAVSDSGGVQEEVTVLKRPLVVVRRSTERPEALGTFSRLVPEPEHIGDVVASWLADPAAVRAALASAPAVRTGRRRRALHGRHPRALRRPLTTPPAPAGCATLSAMSSFWIDRKVAVTGATGLLGSHLTALLVEAGADVVVLQRDEIPESPLVSGWYHRVAVVRGDITDQALLERMLAEYEVRTLFHLAAQSQVGVANRNPVSTFEANIAGTWCVLEAARRSPGIEQVVVASSDKAYGEQAVLPYDEAMGLLACIPTTCRRRAPTSSARVPPHLRHARGHHPLRQLLRPRRPQLGTARPRHHPFAAPRRACRSSAPTAR